MSANEIILPKDTAPSDPPPAVSKVNDVCYEFIKEWISYFFFDSYSIKDSFLPTNINLNLLHNFSL